MRHDPERQTGGGLASPHIGARLGPFNAEKVRIFATLGGGVLALDFATKWIVQESFFLGQSRPVLGSFFRLTYIINPGAAFGFQVGGHSRLVFTILGTGVLLLLFTLYRWTSPVDRLRLGVIAVVCGGALGNLLDRMAHPFGVVDFFDVGIGRARLPIFNVADVAISVGALLLAASFWQEGHEDEKEKVKDGTQGEGNDVQEDRTSAGGDP